MHRIYQDLVGCPKKNQSQYQNGFNLLAMISFSFLWIESLDRILLEGYGSEGEVLNIHNSIPFEHNCRQWDCLSLISLYGA